MLYETFADSRYCTNEFTRNDRDYPAALELAADIADKLIAAYVRAMTARQQSMDDAADEIKDLIALDGDLAGLSQRQIGIRLYGEALVSEQWVDANARLRLRVRNAIKRGRALMTGDYRKLLSGQ